MHVSYCAGLGHYNITSTPTKLAGDLAGVTVVQVATYGDCCLALSSDGGVFGWGNSEYLQLASVTDSTQVCSLVSHCLCSAVSLAPQKKRRSEATATSWPWLKTVVLFLCAFRFSGLCGVCACFACVHMCMWRPVVDLGNHP